MSSPYSPAQGLAQPVMHYPQPYQTDAPQLPPPIQQQPFVQQMPQTAQQPMPQPIPPPISDPNFPPQQPFMQPLQPPPLMQQPLQPPLMQPPPLQGHPFQPHPYAQPFMPPPYQPTAFGPSPLVYGTGLPPPPWYGPGMPLGPLGIGVPPYMAQHPFIAPLAEMAAHDIIPPSELAAIVPLSTDTHVDRDLARLLAKAHKYGGVIPGGHASRHKYAKYAFLAGLLLAKRGLPAVAVPDDPDDPYVKLLHLYLSNTSRLGPDPDAVLIKTLARRGRRHHHHHHHHHRHGSHRSRSSSRRNRSRSRSRRSKDGSYTTTETSDWES